jgi:hypothetical protein
VLDALVGLGVRQPPLYGPTAAGGGVYLTDGVFVFQVAGFEAGEADGMVALENCRRLDRVRVPVTAAPLRRCRIVIWP